MKLFLAAVLVLALIGCGSSVPTTPVAAAVHAPVTAAQIGFESLRSSAFQINVATERLVDASTTRKSIVKSTKDPGLKQALVKMGKYLHEAGEEIADYSEKPDASKIGDDLNAQGELKEHAAAAHAKALKLLGNARAIAHTISHEHPNLSDIGRLSNQLDAAYDSVQGALITLTPPANLGATRSALSQHSQPSSQ